MEIACAQFVAYFRVSTDRQGRSGLGLDAQREAVMAYLNGGAHHLIGEFVEIESGRRKMRPQLLAALELCRRAKATLVIAKLDRLARNVAFVSALLESRARFVAVDMPEADVTFLQMAAVFGEWEARKISERTKAALAVAKARGKALGWSMPHRREEQARAAVLGAASNRFRAAQFAANVVPVIDSIKKTGICSLVGIASALNARGIPTARNTKWYPATVRNVVMRQS